MIGMDKYNVASQLAFYGSEGGYGFAASVGGGILGGKSLMDEHWYLPEPLRGRPALMVALKRSAILDPGLARWFTALGEPREGTLTTDGRPTGRFHFRTGYGYLGAGTEPPPVLRSLEPRPTHDR